MIHGLLNIDKPIGISSAQAVNLVKRIFHVKKAGHLGTLDPLASGVLPIVLGEATKIIPYLNSTYHSKAYDFTVQWGKQTTTDDANGEAVKSSSIIPEYDQIDSAIKYFIGEITQTPPAFSAVKINGIRAYKLARKGKEITIKSRPVYVHDIKLISVNKVNNTAHFFMICGSGVYVRSIARDLGITLKSFGYVAKLRRTQVGDFQEKDSIDIARLTKKDKVIPITSLLRSIPKIELSIEDAQKVKAGREILLNNLFNLKNHDICCTTVDSIPIAICSFIYGYIKPVRVFNI